jgi:CTP synthase
MSDQKKVTVKGGSMRLGVYKCRLNKDSRAHAAYKKDLVMERHRHRYEFNNAYRKQLTKAGLIISGENPDRKLVEIVELRDHPWFVGVQFHPEFQSRPVKPHPLFKDFISAALKFREQRD